MHHVVFVAPFLAETTLRFVSAVAELPGVALHVISQDARTKVPATLSGKISGYLQLADTTSPGALGEAVRSIHVRTGGVKRLLGTLEQLQVPLGQVRDQLGIQGMDEAEAKNFRDKARMKTVLREAGLPCARHGLVSTVAEGNAFAERVGFPLVVKPPAGAGAQGTHRVDDAQAFGACLDMMRPSPGRPVLIEEFITGEEHSFDAIAIDGRVVWHSINRYFPTPLEVIEHPWIQWCVLSPREVDAPEWQDIREAGAAALRALGMRTGLSHTEWFRRPDGSIALSEVAARPPGAQFTTLASYANDFDLYRAWARLMVFDQFEPQPRPYAAGAAFLRGQGQGRVRAIHGIAEANKELGDLVVESRLPRTGQPPSDTYEGEGYVILRHPETTVVRDALLKIISMIRVELS